MKPEEEMSVGKKKTQDTTKLPSRTGVLTDTTYNVNQKATGSYSSKQRFYQQTCCSSTVNKVGFKTVLDLDKWYSMSLHTRLNTRKHKDCKN